MEFKCIHTGSSGNCYVVKVGDDIALLDLGVNTKYIPVNLNDVSFAFVSHAHKDHSAFAENIQNRGIQVIEGRNYQTYSKVVLNRIKTANLKAFVVPVAHGEELNGALLLMTPTEKILYATDFIKTKGIDLSSIKFTSLILECNYNEALITESFESNPSKYKRQISTHMGLKGLEIFLDKLDLSECKEIYLVHCSEGVGDPIQQGVEISKRYKIKTGVCRTRGGIDFYGTWQ